MCIWLEGFIHLLQDCTKLTSHINYISILVHDVETIHRDSLYNMSYFISYVVGLLAKAAVTDYDDSSQVTTTDCMPSDPLSKSHPAGTIATGRRHAPSPSLSSSWPASQQWRRSPLSGLSERTKRLLGRVSPEKLLASAGVSLSALLSI